MPYEAAKAVAATFCWKMRHALTPVFGLDFPDLCLAPDDPHYGDMMIDHDITKRCTDEAAAYRLIELERRNTDARASPGSGSFPPGPLTPSTPTHPRPYKELRPKALKLDTSGYTTEGSSRDEKYQLASEKNGHYRNVWTPANTPCSDARMLGSRDILAASGHKRGASRMSSSSSELSSPGVSPKTIVNRGVVADEEYVGDSSASERDGLKGLRGRDGRMIGRARMPSDERAAYLLMGLRLHKGKGEGLLEGEALGAGRKRRMTG
jgi:hypothetical protein